VHRNLTSFLEGPLIPLVLSAIIDVHHVCRDIERHVNYKSLFG